MSVAITASIEWKGKEYEFKYSFDIAQKLRDEGVNIGKIYRALMADPACAIDFGDDISRVIAWMMKRAGCPADEVSAEEVWRMCMSSEEVMKQTFGMFMWLCNSHFASSPMAPAVKPAASGKEKARRKKT